MCLCQKLKVGVPITWVTVEVRKHLGFIHTVFRPLAVRSPENPQPSGGLDP